MRIFRKKLNGHEDHLKNVQFPEYIMEKGSFKPTDLTCIILKIYFLNTFLDQLGTLPNYNESFEGIDEPLECLRCVDLPLPC